MSMNEYEEQRRVELLQEVFDLQARHLESLNQPSHHDDLAVKMLDLDLALQETLAELLPLMGIDTE